MSIWYAICDLLPFQWLHFDFMKNALLVILILGPLFGILSTMIVTGKMSFFSDALGHSAFTGIAIGVLCGFAAPTWCAILFAIVFALLITFVRSKTTLSGDTVIGVFSSTAVALGIFIATLNGGSFTSFNKYLIGDVLSVQPSEILLLAIILVILLILWCFISNKLILTAIHPQLSASRGIPVVLHEVIFTVLVAVVVTLSISRVGLMVVNTLLILPAAGSRNIARNLRQYTLLCVLSALVCGIAGLITSYYLSCSTGATICLYLAVYFAITFCFRKTNI